MCGGRVLEKLKQDERSGDGDVDTCVEEKKHEKKRRKRNVWSVWMQGKKGKRIKNTIKCYQNISQ